MIKMDRINSFSPTPNSSHPQHYQQTIYYEQHPVMYAPMDQHIHYDMAGQPMMTPQGRMIMPMSSHPSSSHMSMECGPSPFLPEGGHSPFGQHVELPPNPHGHQMVSPTEHLHQAPLLQRNHSLPLTHASLAHRPHRAQSGHAPARPSISRGHTMHGPPRPAPLHRQASLQVAPVRSASPHMMAGDIFDPTPGSPVKRPSSTLGFAVEAGQVYDQELIFHNAQGISPARALGPAPQLQIFSPTANNPMLTPYNKVEYEHNVHSSASSSAATSSSSITASSHHSVKRRSSGSEDENESPTRGPSASRAMSKMQLNERAGPSRIVPSRPQSLVVRPQRPLATVKPMSGGRTSAKFAKVAEDPGVEGIPPGPRTMDRPGPSFACIIGQAILKCSAGGLSLEHIYRYVETAYPFFKSGDGAWRNSVRHNLSIHKMFETIPRTEMFPPGKGGIWVIHEDEKCHWPEENKFIKNFPASHPHHHVCRQTLHERAKEKDAMDKAAKEGREYVPKKGKKGRKLTSKDEEGGGMDMLTMSSDLGEHYFAGPSMTPTMQNAPLPTAALIATSDVDFEDEGEFLPEEDLKDLYVETMPIEEEQPPTGLMFPPRLERKEKRRLIEDEENVFTTATTTKRVRVAEPAPRPLSTIHAHPQESVVDLDDTFITPERERPTPSAKVMSSAFKTPALVNTSSSPGSSPMPPTITRTTHHPSALQQAWTHDDMADAGNDSSSPQRPMLDAAFDFQPKNKSRARTLVAEDEYPISSANPPKTPLSRSSAAREMKTPGNGIISKTPLTFGRSPAQPPPTISALLSTPMWEMGGCLDRLKDYGSSPTASIRSPMPPTSPTRYAMLMGSGASPQSRRMREFSL